MFFFKEQCYVLSLYLSVYLMTDLDNSDANEQLKFSILKRLPEVSFLLNCSLEICLMKSDPCPTSCSELGAAFVDVRINPV